MIRVWFHIKLRAKSSQPGAAGSRADCGAADRQQMGFSPIEILLAASVFGMLVVALAGSIIYGRTSTASSGDRARAVALAEEGAEAVRNMRDESFSTLLTTGDHGLTRGSGVWAFSGSFDDTGSSPAFRRVVNIADVDSARKAVTSTVTWTIGGVSHSVSTVIRLTDWLATMSSWANAVQSGSLDLSGTVDGLKVATAGNYAYFVRNGGTPNFFIVDISNPASPSLVPGGSLTLSGTPTNIAVSGSYAYVSNISDTQELQVISVATPGSPSQVGSYNATGTGNGRSVFIRGATAYLSRLSDTTTNAFEFTVINVSTPATPTLIGGYNNNVNMDGVYVPSGNYGFTATASNTAEVMVINLTTLTLAASLNLSGNTDATTLAGAGTTLFVGQGPTLHSVNIATPTSPSVLDSLPSTGSGTVNDITLHATENYAFIATAASANEFQVVDTTNLSNLSVVRTVDVSGTSTLNGAAYNSGLDVVVAASISNTEEFVIFTEN